MAVSYSIIKTKRPAVGASYRGGVTSWKHVEREIRLLLRDTSIGVLSTLIDYYGFPDDAPGMADRPAGDAMARVVHVERAQADAIMDRRFRRISSCTRSRHGCSQRPPSSAHV